MALSLYDGDWVGLRVILYTGGWMGLRVSLEARCVSESSGCCRKNIK